MNSFKVRIKRGGEWVDYDSSAVFPFRWGELLDERLDEAYLDSINSPVQNYEPTTEISVTVNDGVNSKTEYYIVARDDSARYPIWSDKYRHAKYLIERTKLLEGILCPSLTFTNALGKNFLASAAPAIAEEAGNDESYFERFNISNFFVPEIKFAYPYGAEISLPTALEVGNQLISEIRQKNEEYTDGSVGYSGLPDRTWITVDNGGEIYNYDSEYSIPTSFFMSAGGASVVYDLAIQLNESNGTSRKIEHFKLRFDMLSIENKYPLKRWTITDCVNRVLECAEPLRRGVKGGPRYKFDGVSYFNGLVQNYDGDNIYAPGSQAAEYDKIYAPEFSMTQCTLREQLKVIGSFIHAEPWLDENDVVRFKPYGIARKSKLEGKEYVYDSYSNDINNYCTDVRSNAQNLVSSLGYARGVIYDPSAILFRSLRTQEMYARVTEENGAAITDLPIYNVQEVYCGLVNENNTGYYISPCNITPYVFEATEYGANLSSYSRGYPNSKEWAVYYTIGGNRIDGLFFRAPTAFNNATFSEFAISNILSACNNEGIKKRDIETLIQQHPENLIFKIVYKPITSTMVSHGKQEYVTGKRPFTKIYNQSESLIESDFYGENIKGVAARLGNVERERTYILHSLLDIPETGEMLDGYAISAVSVEVHPRHIKCTVGMTKNFNRISEYIGVSSIKRLYEVSERDTYRRDILIKETLVIGEGNSDQDTLFQDISAIRDIFVGGAGGGKQVSMAKAVTYNRAETELYTNIFPIVPRALGNAITFSFSFKDNYSAGSLLQYVSGNENTADVTGWWQTDARYTDYYGRAYWLDVELYSNEGADISELGIVQQARKLPELVLGEDNNSTLPYAPIYTTGKLLFRKDNREIPSITLELEIKTTVPELNIGSGIARLCRWISAPESTAIPHLYYFKTDTLNKFAQNIDTTDTETLFDCGEIAVTENVNNSFKIKRGQYSSIGVENFQYYGWIIAVPSTTKEREVSDEAGNTVTEIMYEGGDVLLSKAVKFIGGPEGPYSELLNGLNFYVINE